MKIYYRELDSWHKAFMQYRSGDYEKELKEWCINAFGKPTHETWHTFRPPRTKIWVRPGGIEFAKDEYATAFLLVFK